MNELYNKLETYFQFEKADSIVISISKSILLIISGAYFGLFLKEINSEPAIYRFNHLIYAVIGVIICMYIEYRRLKKERNFPVSILEHLKASEELQNLRNLYSRKIKIYEYIDNSIQSLNSNTCPILGGSENDLCHQDLSSGLLGVLTDLVERPNYFLNIDETKFTVGVYLENIHDRNSKIGELQSSEKFFILRDDLEINDQFPESLFNMESEEEEYFQIQTAIMESKKFDKYLCKRLTLSTRNLTIICSPITNVCEDCPPDGVIFTIYTEEKQCSPDMENVFQIFGRIVSNWISKYNDCVRSSKNIKVEEKHDHKEVLGKN
ncbi:hypothetical protein D0809_06845 [Flavobacterium circumlabens]|uniref:Uncharacterized protein n=1 Tax=Flavobacterium circumlabens TaxID=2133765 RepID=A0A4Y7UEP4_9FLAO|nr:hypothetical protein [Flavobacterium circumlabens]TCN59619.1 hypothetical protein EV142_102237 [Flavobacterium circumlabens]TEB44897.1 hypothetical protein D0809_06845 [Flavobacterium circumlabens]